MSLAVLVAAGKKVKKKSVLNQNNMPCTNCGYDPEVFEQWRLPNGVATSTGTWNWEKGELVI